MVEALWSIEFQSNGGSIASGVVVFESQRVLGGDAQYFYVGSYSIENHIIHATVKITHYAGEPNTVFGPLDEATLHLSGMVANDTFEISGTVVEKPDSSVLITFTRRAELP
jgi:hypothetical protein